MLFLHFFIYNDIKKVILCRTISIYHEIDQQFHIAINSPNNYHTVTNNIRLSKLSEFFIFVDHINYTINQSICQYYNRIAQTLLFKLENTIDIIIKQNIRHLYEYYPDIIIYNEDDLIKLILRETNKLVTSVKENVPSFVSCYDNFPKNTFDDIIHEIYKTMESITPDTIPKVTIKNNSLLEFFFEEIRCIILKNKAHAESSHHKIVQKFEKLLLKSGLNSALGSFNTLNRHALLNSILRKIKNAEFEIAEKDLVRYIKALENIYKYMHHFFLNFNGKLYRDLLIKWEKLYNRINNNLPISDKILINSISVYMRNSINMQSGLKVKQYISEIDFLLQQSTYIINHIFTIINDKILAKLPEGQFVAKYEYLEPTLLIGELLDDTKESSKILQIINANMNYVINKMNKNMCTAHNFESINIRGEAIIPKIDDSWYTFAKCHSLLKICVDPMLDFSEKFRKLIEAGKTIDCDSRIKCLIRSTI